MLEPPPLETLLYFTTLSYTKSIVFSKVVMPLFSYSIKKRPLKVLFNIINIKKKYTAAFNISLSINFNLSLLPQLIPYHFLTAFILY